MQKVIHVLLGFVLCGILGIGCGGGSSDNKTPLSDNAKLSTIVVYNTFDDQALPFVDTFKADTFEYALNEPHDCSLSNIYIKVDAQDENATITIDDYSVTSSGVFYNLYLEAGDNRKDIIVTAEDGTTLTYTVIIPCSAEADLQFDGFYLTDSDPHQLIRFYEEDQRVISVTAYGDVDNIKTWFNRDNENVAQGQYSITQNEGEERKIDFSTENEYGKVTFEGIILANELYLDYTSDIVGYGGTRIYNFEPLDLTGLE